MRVHPHTYYATLFEHGKRDEIFVAMSFAPEFEPRWRDIIDPCIREDLKLRPTRVDYNRSGESVVHDILDGIAHARLVVVDITSTKMTDRRSSEWPVRNANVMWELGIAHVMRMPDEVIVVRSDSERSLFDLTQFRAFEYDPRDPIEARRILRTLCEDRIKSVQEAASAHVMRCAAMLDWACFEFLFEAVTAGAMRVPQLKTFGELLGGLPRIQAITRLLELGALKTQYPRISAEELKRAAPDAHGSTMMRYEVTKFGYAVFVACAKQLGLFDAELQAAIAETMPQEPRGDAAATGSTE